MNKFGTFNRNILSFSIFKVHKGQHPDKEAYSAFDKHNSSNLEQILPTIGATHLYVCGLAYDICVKETSLAGLRLGYRLAVIDDCCRSIKPDDITSTKKLITENGGLLTCSDDVLSFVNEGKHNLVMAHHAAKFIN